jgi:ribonuclease HII
MARPDWQLERLLWASGYPLVAGVDEAGRGALAGPVVAAVVVLPYGEQPYRDSKLLATKVREALAERAKAEALAWAIGSASPSEIDRLNILAATHLAAKRALSALACAADALVTDYLALAYRGPVLAVPKGEQRSVQIAAASILAKSARDKLMRELAQRFPSYGFAEHKGYAAKRHLDALAEHGPCEAHRKSFRPVAQGRLF